MVFEELAPYLPALKSGLQSAVMGSARESAVSELEKTKGFEGIRSLFSAPSGETIEFRGRRIPATPFNKAVKANPDILNIKREGRNEKESAVLTQIAIFRAAYRQAKPSGMMSPKAVKAVVNATKASEANKVKAGGKQGLNGGGNAARGGGGKAASASPTDYIRQATNRGTSIEDL